MKTQTLLALIVTAFAPSLAHADQYSDVCGDTSQPPTGQKAEYCASANQSQSASKKEKTLTLIYAAVAGTCAASCMDFEMATYPCQIGAVGAAAADMLITKNFTSMFMTGMSGGLGLVDTMNEGKGATTTIFGKTFKTSCITAATSAMGAFLHNSSRAAAEQTANSNLESAKTVANTTPNTYQFDNASGSSTSTGTQIASTSSTATSLAPTTTNSTSSTGACGDTTSVSGAASCAATADPKIAGLVSSDAFQKAFQKTSGMSLGDFLKNGGNLSPSDAIKASAGAALGADASVQLGKAVAAVEKEMPNFNTETPAAYAAGGSRKSGSADPDLAGMMNGLMSKLMPKSEEEKQSGVSEVKFAGATRRNLASVTAEDPTVSLFDRVAFRYSNVTSRLFADPNKRKLSEW